MKQTSYLGHTFTDADVLKALKQFDKGKRQTLQSIRWGKDYAIRYNGQDYPPKEIMRDVIGTPHVGRGGKYLNSRFQEVGFEVVRLEEDDVAVTEIESLEEAETEIALSLEYDLEKSLISNLEQLEKGLKIYQERGVPGQQFDTKDAGRIDILAIDAAGNLVVVELKASIADRQVCGQIQAYMGWVKENLAKDNRVRGIIVANDFTVRAVYAAKVVPDLTLKKYQISFRFSDA